MLANVAHAVHMAARPACPIDLHHHDHEPSKDDRVGPRTTLSGDGLCIGRDSGDNVSQEYKAPGAFKGGTILGVGIDVSEESYLDLHTEAAGAFARD
jgi:hypothetical protein